VPDIWVGACSKSLRQIAADLKGDVCVAVLKSLRISVRNDELDAANSSLDHAIDRIASSAADTDDLDHCQIAAAVHF
jgi:hypothetical protein